MSTKNEAYAWMPGGVVTHNQRGFITAQTIIDDNLVGETRLSQHRLEQCGNVISLIAHSANQ
jgi:hypothetical protein